MPLSRFTLAVCTSLLAAAWLASAADPSGTVERLDPALDALIAPTATIDKLSDSFKTLGGSLWRPSGVLWVTDLRTNVLAQISPDGTVSELLNPGGYNGHDLPATGLIGPNGMAPGPNNTVTLCQHGNRRIVSVSPDHKVTVLVDRYEGKRLNSPNDVVYGPEGALYFTDPPKGLPQKDADPAKELSFNGVFRYAKGKLQPIVENLATPDGIAFSPDYRTLYLTNTDATHRQWLRCDVTANGGANNCRLFLDASSSPDRGSPDGMKVDTAGNLYAAGPGGVWIVSPEGKHLGTIRTPEIPGGCTWGDDGKTLYITGRTTVYKIRTRLSGAATYY